MSSQRYGLDLRAVRKNGLHQNFICEGGGTGRRARLRCVWFILGGSNPLPRTRKYPRNVDEKSIFRGFFCCLCVSDTACFCRVLCSQDRSQKKVGHSRIFPGFPRDKKVVKIMNQAAVSVKQRQRPDSSRGLFVHIMVRTVERPCCSTPLFRRIKNDLKPELEVIFYAGEGGRTLTLLELVPKTSASAIPPLPHGNFIYSSKIRRKSQLPKDNSLVASA